MQSSLSKIHYCIRLNLALVFLLCVPFHSHAQMAGVANLKYVAIKSSGSSAYDFDQFNSLSNVTSGTPLVHESKTWSRQIRSVTSDGDRWYAVLRTGTTNCFTVSASYDNMLREQPESLRCNSLLADGYRGIAYDGNLFHALYWDGEKHWWCSYRSWDDLITNTPYARQTSNVIAQDIYKAIGYDPSQRVYFSLAQSGGTLFLFKYATFSDMMAGRSTSDSATVQTSQQYAGMVVGPVNPTLDIYVVAGQSNAVGWDTDGAWLPADAADNDISFFYRIGNGLDASPSTSGSVTKLKPQVSAFRSSTPPTNFGIEMGIGRSLYGAGRRNMAIVKVAFGGTDLYTNWHPLNANGLLKILQNNLSFASVQWNQAGYRTRLAGFFWMQGEADGADPTKANLYLSNLRTLTASIRTWSGNKNLPVVIGRIRTEGWPYAATIRSAQAQLAAEDGYIRMVNTDDLDLQPNDIYHFTSQGEYTLGQRMADAYRNIGGW